MMLLGTLHGGASVPATNLFGDLTYPASLGPMLDAGLEAAVLLLAFTLAIFAMLVFAIRALLIFRKLPVPLDPLDMAKPKGFRAIMLFFSVLLAPLVSSAFLPETGLGPRTVFLVAYLFEIAIAVGLWFAFEVFYKFRDRRSGRRV
jgi:hypothetical protein